MAQGVWQCVCMVPCLHGVMSGELCLLASGGGALLNGLLGIPELTTGSSQQPNLLHLLTDAGALQVRTRVAAMARPELASALGPDQLQLGKGVDRMAAQNLVTIALLRRALADGSPLLPVTLEVSSHCPYFPVLALQKKKEPAAAAAGAAK